MRIGQNNMGFSKEGEGDWRRWEGVQEERIGSEGKRKENSKWDED